jgi:WD40 repeat protein
MSLVATSDANSIKIWGLYSYKCVHTFPNNSNIENLTFSHNNLLLAYSCDTHTIVIYNLYMDAEDYRFTVKGYIKNIIFSPNDEYIIIQNQNTDVFLYSLNNKSFISRICFPNKYICNYKFNCNSDILAVSYNDGTINIIQIITGQVLYKLTEHSNHVWAIDFNKDGSLLVSGDDDSFVYVWCVENNFKCLYRLKLHTTPIWELNFSDNNIIAFSYNKSIKIELDKLTTKKLIYNENLLTIYYKVFNHSKQIIVLCNENDEIMVWSVKLDKLLYTLSGHTNYIMNIIFNNDYDMLVSFSTDESIRTWDLKTGLCTKVIYHSLK